MPPRRGTVYVAVLGVALIVSLVSLAGLHLARVETDVLVGADQVAQAELLSQSACEFGISRLLYDSDWRTNNTSGADASSGTITLGAGTFKYQLIDVDGNLADNDRDGVTVRGIGRVGEATQVTTVDLEPANSALTCLDVAIHAVGKADVMAGTVTIDRMVSSNDEIRVTGSGTIVGDAWSTGAISGSVTGIRYPASTPARRVPNTVSAWVYYLANATAIDIDTIPSQTIDKKVLSAANNPYGAENPQGIYLIDTEGQTLHIRDSRINATLVVISPLNETEIEATINWAAPSGNFPALMVKGDLRMEWSGGSSLVESTAGVNFNPAGTPYETVADSDTTDSYPGIIKGLVYCSEDLTVTTACVVQGSLVAGGDVDISANVTVAHSASPATFPPPGFAWGNVMRVVPRTWRRVAQ